MCRYVQDLNDDLELEEWCKPVLEINRLDWESTGYGGRCALIDQVTGDGIDFIQMVFKKKVDGAGLSDASIVKPLPPVNLGPHLRGHLVLSKSLLASFWEYADTNHIPGYGRREQIKHAFLEAVAILDQEKLTIMAQPTGAVIGLCSGFSGQGKRATKMGVSGCLEDCTKCKSGFCCTKTFAYIIHKCKESCYSTMLASQGLMDQLQPLSETLPIGSGGLLSDPQPLSETLVPSGGLLQPVTLNTTAITPRNGLEGMLAGVENQLQSSSVRSISSVMTKWKKNHPVNFGLVVHACRAAGGGGSKKGGKDRATGEQRSAAYHRNATEKSNRVMATPEFRDLDVDADFTNSGRESKYTVHKWNASFEVGLCCSQCKNVFECDETFVQEVHRKKQQQDVTGLEAYCDSWTTTSWCLSICLLCPLHTGWP